MDMVRNQLKILLAAACSALFIPALAATHSLPHVYPDGSVVASKLGNDLYLTLDPKFQQGLHPNPVMVANMDALVITPIAVNDGNKTLGAVSISAGYIGLLHHLAHAKAIDRIQPGYFEQYVLNLARENGSNSLPGLPNIIDNRYWTEDVMNDQFSYFNQMIGMTLALNLSHHYLGDYTRFSSRMLAGKLVPINNFIPPDSWDAGLKAATLNCLNCAVATAGAKALFEAIDKMPSRPPWAAFIVPPATDLKILNNQLKKYEDDFFHGRLN